MICLDTSPVIWGVRGFAEPEQQEMIARARSYIAYLDKEKIPIMFPAPALAEYLVGCGSPEQRDKESRWIEAHFQVPALDIRAAQVVAELMEKDLMQALHGSATPTRQELWVDAQIIAVAIVNQAQKIITHNTTHFRRLAGGRIPISEIPDIATQPELEFPMS